VRKISKTLALMSLLAPLGANALGIGDIRLHSALNQSLNAEIPLVTSGGEELADVRVSLAPAEAFARAGIERHYSLSKLRFSPQQKADGSYVIKVSSVESIREPFLNFMIEVHWPQGRLQREFTVLLDPPASSAQEAEESEEELPEVQTYRRPVEQPMRRAVEAAPIVPSKPRRPVIVREASVIEAPAPQAAPEPVPVSGAQYGPISKNETLWSIAQQHNQDESISQEKMLRAIYKANPQAFYKNNINALKAGETITIPDRETIVRLTGAPSGPQTIRHTGKLAAKPEKPAEQIAAPGEISAQGQLKLVAPSPSKSKDEAASSGAKGKAGKTKEDIALEAAAETVKQENDEVRKSLADMKEQLAGIQRLLALKDEQIAALQAQQKQAVKEPAQAAPPTPPHVASGTVPAVAEPGKTPAPPPTQEAQAKPPTPPKPTEAAPATPPPIPPAAKRPPAPAKPAQPPAPPKEEGIVAGMMEHPTYYAIGGITGILALAVWLIKRRRAAMIDETESILTLGDREKTIQPRRPPISLGQPPSGISEQSTVTSTTSRSSFLSEFTPSDFDALGGEMEEVDPISEADVYLAYGRYKQAEELIRNAIAQNPERDECKLKLLEIHYATENAQAFEKFAEELAPTHRDAKPEFWEKVAEMGQELCPDSALFGDGSGTPAAAAASGGHHGTATAVEGKAEPAEEEEDYFFKKKPEESYGYPGSPTIEANAEEIEENPSAIAYDFFTTNTQDSAKPAGAATDDEGQAQHLDNVISFDFDKTPTEHTDEPTETQDKTLDDILAELGVLSESAALSHEEDIVESDESNSIDFDIEFKKMLEADNANHQYEDDSADEQMALMEMDEYETKLDLAKAYFDMGDDEAARVILESVAENGNDTQKEEAWSLLGGLTRKEVNSR